jgi:hypothetical protein
MVVAVAKVRRGVCVRITALQLGAQTSDTAAFRAVVVLAAIVWLNERETFATATVVIGQDILWQLPAIG